MRKKKTAIVTGAQQRIGAGVVEALWKKEYNVVGTSLKITQPPAPLSKVVFVDGDIGKPETAAKVVSEAIKHFGTVDILVNDAGIFRSKPFTDYTSEDFDALVSTDVLGFLHVTQLCVNQMLKQKSGNVVTISASLADQPVASIKAAVSMMTKGALNTATRHLAIEYEKDGTPLQCRRAWRRGFTASPE